ncbi:hypothetical protein [uncultured Litoreibacter sp.]|uniref:hypothetical protein n=1 Tax=uncultured Litoreibacter sp. TaxID=1392394 RepID=UPI0026378B49|nr:hypothetical protein [uncultured Litoreibacter sp.]
MRRAALLLLALTAACGRPLSEGEEAFARAWHGEGLDTEKVRIVQNPLIKLYVSTSPIPPRTTCAENILPPSTDTHYTGSPAATVLFNKITVNPDIAARDYMAAWPRAAHLRATMFLAHELVHTWQWQHRDRTGYHPLKAAREHQYSEDPYLFDLSNEAKFLDYGYEQQGAIAAEYVCCAALDPEGRRTQRLKALLEQEFPIQNLSKILPQTPVVLPWKGVMTQGICS